MKIMENMEYFIEYGVFREKKSKIYLSHFIFNIIFFIQLRFIEKEITRAFKNKKIIFETFFLLI